MPCFFSIPFSNNPNITPWGSIGPDGVFPAEAYQNGSRHYEVPSDKANADSIQSQIQYWRSGEYDPFRQGCTYRYCDRNQYMYYVQPGDTLYSISIRLGVNLLTVVEANPGSDTGNLSIGQTLCIPAFPCLN